MTYAHMSREQRQAERRRLHNEIMATAKVHADRPGRSMKCSGDGFAGIPRHADYPDIGCKNDGSNCLCQCHDPKAIA